MAVNSSYQNPMGLSPTFHIRRQRAGDVVTNTNQSEWGCSVLQLGDFSDLLLTYMTESVRIHEGFAQCCCSGPLDARDLDFNMGFHDHRNWAESSGGSYSSNCIVTQT